MSLLSADRLSVFVSPTEVLSVLWRGLPRRIAHKRRHPVPVGSGADWHGAAEAFAAALREAACRRVHVTLSCHFTPFQLLPWRDDLRDGEEERAAARIAFADSFGDAAERWSIALGDEPPGQPRVAAAIDADFLDALQRIAHAARSRIVRLQPYLIAVVNGWRDDLRGRQPTWLVLHEESRACLALIERGRWRWLRCLRIEANWAEQLPELIEHEILLAGIEDVPMEILVFAPALPDLALREAARGPLRSLRLKECAGFSPSEDGRFGFAFVG